MHKDDTIEIARFMLEVAQNLSKITGESTAECLLKLVAGLAKGMWYE